MDHAKRDAGAMPELDLLRFMAAIAVMLFHLGAATWAFGPTQQSLLLQRLAGYPEAMPFVWFGWIGVEIFFVISGIVIATSARASDPLNFIIGRIARLYPAAIICACISAALLASSSILAPEALVGRMARSVFLWPYGPWLDDVYWTLGIEMSFYALVTVMLVAGKANRLQWLGVAIGMVSAAYWLVGLGMDARYPLALMWNRGIELSLVSYGCYFGLGVLLSPGRQSLPHWALLSAIPMLAACYAEIYFKTLHVSATAGANLSPLSPWTAFTLSLALAWIAVRNPRTRSGAAARTLRMLGLVTYPLYLIHNVAGPMAMAVLLNAGLGRWTALGLAMAGCIALSFPIAGLADSCSRSLRPWLLSLAHGRRGYVPEAR